MRAQRILVAGIGNIFLGDDAFGVEVVRELKKQTLPVGVNVVDFGIRSYDLAFAIADGYDAIILVDATPRGEPPGTVSLIKPDLNDLRSPSSLSDGHSLNPVSVLQMTTFLQAKMGELYVVGCEPAVLEAEDGRMELSETVTNAIPQAVEMIQSLIGELRGASEVREEPLLTKGVGR